MNIQLSEPCYESIRTSLTDLLKEWKRLHQENNRLIAKIAELKAADELYGTAETGPEYSFAHQRYVESVKALFEEVGDK